MTFPTIASLKRIRWRYVFIRLSTAPGVIVHEFAHRFMCSVFGVPVADTVYFQMTGRPGYVKHATPRSWIQSVSISFAPLVINILAAVLAFQYSLGIHSGRGVFSIGLGLGLIWLTFVFLLHSIPSTADTRAVWEVCRQRWYRWPLELIIGPVFLIRALGGKVGIFRIMAPLSVSLIAIAISAHGITAETLVSCIREGSWGCWDTDLVLFDMMTESILWFTDYILDWFLEQQAGSGSTR